MNNHNEEKYIKGLLENFSATLNAANATAIPTFFTEGGKFMPDGNKTINNPASLSKSTKKHLSSNAFQIQFTVQELEIDGDFAFVTATANTSQLEDGNPLAVTKSSRDFFVLKKVGADWKIHSYIFNNVK